MDIVQPDESQVPYRSHSRLLVVTPQLYLIV